MDIKIEEKWIKHYSSQHQILLVGEGDFSFALCLANAFGSASNIVATSRDSKGSLVKKYSRASTILNELESLGCTILHQVNAHTFHKHPLLQNKHFDRIVYNFPHAGFGLTETDPHQIGLHQEVVLGFFKSARMMLTRDGEVHVTHKNNNPFSKWEIVKLARKAFLVLVEKVPFEISEYPGYVNKRGSGSNCDGSFIVGDSSTYKFSKAKYMDSLGFGLQLLLLDPDPLQLINCVSKINKMLPENHEKGCSSEVEEKSKVEEKLIKHYSSLHKILLVGEGDFSFALCLAKAFGSASNMVATSLDAKESVILNYSRGSANLKELEKLGCTIVHEVDVHRMYKHPLLVDKFFDRIVFNFPQHSKYPSPEEEPYEIKQHQKLVSGFLRNAKKMQSHNGEVHVTHKNDYPFCRWEIVKLAEKAGLNLVKKASFKKKQYPGYNMKRGCGNNWDEKLPFVFGSTFKFSNPSDVGPVVLGLSEIPVDPNSLQPKNSTASENQVVHVLNSTIETSIVSSHKTSAEPSEDAQFVEKVKTDLLTF